MQGTCLSCTEAGIALISHIRPTSESEPEGTTGDITGSMAPPPVPSAKKVRSSLVSSLCALIYYRVPRSYVKGRQSP